MIPTTHHPPPATQHAWWSRLRHQGLLLSPVVMLERYPSARAASTFQQIAKLRDARTRFVSSEDKQQNEIELEQSPILAWVDTLLEQTLGQGRLAKKNNIPEKFTIPIRIGTKTETIRPHRIIFADDDKKVPALLVMADKSPMVGRGRGSAVTVGGRGKIKARTGSMAKIGAFAVVFVGKLGLQSLCAMTDCALKK